MMLLIRLLIDTYSVLHELIMTKAKNEGLGAHNATYWMRSCVLTDLISQALETPICSGIID